VTEVVTALPSQAATQYHAPSHWQAQAQLTGLSGFKFESCPGCQCTGSDSDSERRLRPRRLTLRLTATRKPHRASGTEHDSVSLPVSASEPGLLAGRCCKCHGPAVPRPRRRAGAGRRSRSASPAGPPLRRLEVADGLVAVLVTCGLPQPSSIDVLFTKSRSESGTTNSDTSR
jgi:hypothetical protein